MKNKLIGGLALLALAMPAYANDSVVGLTTIFESYNGVTERCVRIVPLPSAKYDKDDLKDEAELCGLDFYSPDVALCPKIWNSSAAVMVYDLAGSRFYGDRLHFQTEVCSGGKIAKYVAADVLARLKFSMNQESTSSNFTPSSILYYHLSRYFGFSTTVPVTVWRTVDKSVLLNEVALGGQVLSSEQPLLARNNASWTTLIEAIQEPGSYEKPGSYGSSADFLTADGTSVYGALYDGGGTRYGPEMNGAVEFGETEDRYRAFLQTPVVLALYAELPLEDAIADGLLKGGNQFTPDERGVQEITPVQMAFWMREISEILMIDTIMGQQDRPGNIDYREYYYWEEDGKVERKRVRDQVPGDGDIPLNAQILLRTWLNDNDAGGRIEYDNHLAMMRVVEKLRHFDPEVYERLQALNADFQAKGPIFLWLQDSLGLYDHEVDMIVTNTNRVATALKRNLDQGRLRLDLEPKAFFLAATASR